MQKESRIQAFFLHVFMCSVLFDAVRQTELYLTSSVHFGQNGKTPLRSVATYLVESKVCEGVSYEELAIID